MDLEAIGVHVSTYQTFLAFARDVRLVFNNALVYVANSKLAVHDAASILSRLFEEKLSNLILGYSAQQRSAQRCVHTEPSNLLQSCSPAAMAADRMLIALNWDEAASSSVEIRFDTKHSRVGLPAVTRALQQPSRMLKLLWGASRSESCARRSAFLCGATIHEQLAVDATHIPRISGLGCDGEAKHLLVTTAGSAESISRHERDQDRQRERNAARRQRNELEQTIDLERQRLIVSKFLARAAGSISSIGFDKQDEGA
jgi:hypothetical protein